MSLVVDRSQLVRATLTQVEFFKVCRTLENDTAIRDGLLDFEQIMTRYASTVFPGRVLSHANIKKALKATQLDKKVKRSANARPNNPMSILFDRQKKAEIVLRRIATSLGIDYSELNERSVADGEVV